MKFTKSIIAIITLASVICGAHAIKLCQLDWFAVWQSKPGPFSNSRYVVVSNWGSQAEGGTWTVTSDEGSPGVQHTVSGMSQCTDDTGTTKTTANPWPSSTLAVNVKCWCGMTSPHVGASWVFLVEYGSAAVCADSCANGCANCVLSGSYYSCSRSAVLALP
ncbi:MAG: hypothetical protein LBL21_03010 [Rickettsiales bacterium]|jgi:hypothetical protein|nr:hypothetical protein [Rickettsiales bacterium]